MVTIRQRSRNAGAARYRHDPTPTSQPRIARGGHDRRRRGPAGARRAGRSRSLLRHRRPAALRLDHGGLRGRPVDAGQPDDKLLIAGSDGSGDFLVKRLLADGAPDRSFGGDGTADADFAGGKDTITAIALQDDGKLVAAGTSEVGIETRTVVARFSAGGVLDPASVSAGPTAMGASPSGPIRSPTSAPWRRCRAEAIALSGATSTSGSDFAVTRLLDSGTVELTYEPIASPDGNDKLTVSARTADGKLLVAGELYRDAPGQLIAGVARYRADGKLDRDFGTDGLVTIPGMSKPHTIVPIAGGILIAGADYDGDEGTVLARLDQKGRPDTGFGSAGLADVGFPGSDLPAGMSVLGDGRILVGVTSIELAFGAVRLSASGRPDARYGEDGIAIVPVGDRAVSTAAAARPAARSCSPARRGCPAQPPSWRSSGCRATRRRSRRAVPNPTPTRSPGRPSTPIRRCCPGCASPPRRGRPAADPLHPVRAGAGADPLKRRSGRVIRFAVTADAGTKRLRAPRRLVRGRYRLTVVAVDAAGNTAAPVRVRFRVRAAT